LTVQDLLPHYERELAVLRNQTREFAQRYPKIASRLQLSGESSEDPHVERLIESFAFLAARVHKRIDDDFPLFTESLLEVLYPHYLRPFPSCSIAQFRLGSAAAQMSEPARVPRGEVLKSRPLGGVACQFRTAYDVDLLPVRLAQAEFRMALRTPTGTRWPSGTTAVVSLRFESLSPQFSLASLAGRTLRVYLDGEPSMVSALREALCAQSLGVLLEPGDGLPWSGPHPERPNVVGFEDNQALIEQDARSHPAYRLLTEYFAFPDKFNFIDLPWPGRAGAAGQPAPLWRSATLHVPLKGLRADSDAARLLEGLEPGHLQLGCTPVVNLFRTPADPIRVTHTRTTYPVLVDARRAHAYEVCAVTRVWRVRQTAQGERAEEFRPFYSLRHDDLAAGDTAARYWYTERDSSLAQRSPGHEVEIGLVDSEFHPGQAMHETLSLEVLATNRDLPTQLAIAQPGGDLSIEGGSLAKEIHLLRKPSPCHRFERGEGALWRLISHLSLNHLSLSQGGLDALKEMLRLYDLPRSASNQRQVDGLVAVDYRPATAWLPGRPYATFVRGTEVRLTVDESSYVGVGLHLFAQVLDRFAGLYVHLNSFSQLTLLSSRTGEELLTCYPRSGAQSLL
jgi:type VI secretion system protein ImpG